MDKDRLPKLLGKLGYYSSCLTDVCPSIFNLCEPKEYAHKLGYGDVHLVTWQAVVSVQGLTLSRDVNENTAQTFSYVACCKLIRYQMPTFFVSEELCEALLQTEAPSDLRFDEIQFPMPAMRFMLPIDFSVRYFGSQVDHLLFAAFSKDEKIQFPGRVTEGTPPTIEIPVDALGFAMIKWENDYPMTYEAHAAMNAQVGKLMDTSKIRFVSDCSETPEEEKSDMDTTRKLTNLTTNILLAMTAEPELITRERIIREGKKKDGKFIRRPLWKPNIIGEHFRIQYDDNVPTGAHHASPRAHWRIGHWRNQRHGELKALVKRIWIRPVFVGLKKDLGNKQ